MGPWVMYAQRQGPDAAGELAHFGAAEWVRMCYGEPVVAVDVVEDAAGSYWGWVDTGEEAGKGWTVRLTVEEHQ